MNQFVPVRGNFKNYNVFDWFHSRIGKKDLSKSAI